MTILYITFSICQLNFMVATPGLEPGRSCEQRILNPMRLPFRHAAMYHNLIISLTLDCQYVVGEKGIEPSPLTGTVFETVAAAVTPLAHYYIIYNGL